MRLVMTLLARNEADIIDAQMAFHLSAGVDFVVATANRAEDGTREILQAYADAGYARLIDEPSDENRQAQWVTRMARLAATEHGADWVINSDADEFWWPRSGSLKTVLEVVPKRYGALIAFPRNFVPRPAGDDFFAERMTVRASPEAPLMTSQFRTYPKVIHRGHADVRVGQGNHTVSPQSLLAFRGWYPIELLHFPLRSLEQCERKYRTAFRVKTLHTARGATVHASEGQQAYDEGRLPEYYDSLSVDDERLERGLADGSLTVDARLRDALRELRAKGSDAAAGSAFVSPQGFAVPAPGELGLALPRADLVEEMRYALDAGVFNEGELVRLQKRLDQFEARLGEIERRPAERLAAGSLRLARRLKSSLRGA